MAKLCILCRVNKATIPDRYAMGRMTKKICVMCHAARLRGDLAHIMKRRAKGEAKTR